MSRLRRKVLTFRGVCIVLSGVRQRKKLTKEKPFPETAAFHIPRVHSCSDGQRNSVRSYGLHPSGSRLYRAKSFGASEKPEC